METTRSMISFDWAMKRLLRNKANFEVLEGFLSELLRRKIIIKSSIEERRIKEGEIHTALLEGEEKGWAKGEAIGLEKGEAIGLEKGKTDIARNLLKDGVSVEDICKYTGLSKQQIQELTP